eukprot:16442763-Heterocapsa_arctica.AAC.1
MPVSYPEHTSGFRFHTPVSYPQHTSGFMPVSYLLHTWFRYCVPYLRFHTGFIPVISYPGFIPGFIPV